MRFYVVLCDFGSPLELLWAPLGTPFRANRAPGWRMGSKVVPGPPKRSLWEPFLVALGALFGDILEDSRSMPSTYSLGSLPVFFRYSSGLPHDFVRYPCAYS